MNTIIKLAFSAGIGIVVFLAGCAEIQQRQGYSIKGQVSGVQAGTVKLVRTNQDRTSTTVDSAGFKDGSFMLKGQVASPELMTLTIEPGNWSLPVFMENGTIKIQADTTGAAHYDYEAYGGGKGAVIKTYTVSGSDTQDNWMKYKNDPALTQFDASFASLQQEYAQAGHDSKKSEEIKRRIDSLRRLRMSAEIKWIDSFITTNPTSATGAYLLENHYQLNQDMPLDQMEQLLARFKGQAPSTKYYKTLSEAVDKRKALLPGHLAPDFTLRTPDSASLTLSSLRGKYVMLDFWASWCVPCRKAIPHWKEIYARYQPKGFEILSVTNDIKWSDWFRALEAEKMPWLQVADDFPVKNMPARVAELYMIPYLPTYVLLDKEGKVLLHTGDENQVEQKLKEVFGS